MEWASALVGNSNTATETGESSSNQRRHCLYKMALLAGCSCRWLMMVNRGKWIPVIMIRAPCPSVGAEGICTLIKYLQIWYALWLDLWPSFSHRHHHVSPSWWVCVCHCGSSSTLPWYIFYSISFSMHGAFNLASPNRLPSKISLWINRGWYLFTCVFLRWGFANRNFPIHVLFYLGTIECISNHHHLFTRKSGFIRRAGGLSTSSSSHKYYYGIHMNLIGTDLFRTRISVPVIRSDYYLHILLWCEARLIKICSIPLSFPTHHLHPNRITWWINKAPVSASVCLPTLAPLCRSHPWWCCCFCCCSCSFCGWFYSTYRCRDCVARWLDGTHPFKRSQQHQHTPPVNIMHKWLPEEVEEKKDSTRWAHPSRKGCHCNQFPRQEARRTNHVKRYKETPPRGLYRWHGK